MFVGVAAYNASGNINVADRILDSGINNLSEYAIPHNVDAGAVLCYHSFLVIYLNYVL